MGGLIFQKQGLKMMDRPFRSVAEDLYFNLPLRTSPSGILLLPELSTLRPRLLLPQVQDKP